MERFGPEAVGELRESLAAIACQVDETLPEYVPIVGGSDGMAAGIADLETRGTRDADTASPSHLPALLSRALLAYTLDFEAGSELSLPLSANVVRVIDEPGVKVRDLPSVAGISKEATSMALTFLTKAGYVVTDGATAATKLARLTPEGRVAQERAPRLHADLEARWESRFGADALHRLRTSLVRVLEQRVGLARGLEPYPEGWRASKPYREQTEALLRDPGARLPHCPMVLHRGGWPDGS